MEYKVCSYPDLKIFMAHTNGIQRTPVHNVNVVTFSASLRGSSFSAAILVAAEEEISEILSQEIQAGKCNDITHKSQNFEKTTFRAICFHASSF